MSKIATMLYVDDEPLNLTLFSINFERKFQILTALSGYEGLNVLKSNPETKVVISDMKMPGMNGVEFIRQAKKDFPDIVYFIFTGFDITHEIAEALRNKLIHKYFSKPLNMKEIENSINEVLFV